MLRQNGQQLLKFLNKQNNQHLPNYPSFTIKYSLINNYQQQAKCKRSRNTSKNVIQTTPNQLANQLQIYQWRSTTQYPIVFSNCTNVLLNNQNSIIKKVPYKINQLGQESKSNGLFMEIQTQVVTPIQHFQPLLFANFIYAIKQSLVAFQRLYTLFGSFQINPQMITVNDKGKVKVWLSHNYFLNTKTNVEYSNIRANQQGLIINQIKSTFIKFTQQNSVFRQFFKHLHYIHTFLDFFKYLEWFIASHKIAIIKFIDKNRQTPKKRPLSPVITLKLVTKVPRFLSPPRDAPNKMQGPSFKNIPRLNLQIQSKLVKQSYQLQEQETKQTILCKYDSNISSTRQNTQQKFKESEKRAVRNRNHSNEVLIDRGFIKKHPARLLQEMGKQVASSIQLPGIFNYI